MTLDADGEQESPGEDKQIGDPFFGVREVSVKDNELKVDGDRRELRAQGGLLVQQQQSQGTAIGWERFLHVTSIKVLLVENDDSTRLVVTALLRNCSYEVIEAANGVQAWKILEDLNNNVDLVLTEVVMPCLSGLGLLYKIMSHKTRKTVPVIMMSSHDSMGVVFKCLSKGAVDFLVKPIRKNELKNLWQHVWRRYHSSSGSGSGSGSESGTQTQKSVHSKRNEKSDNDSGSNNGENDGSNGINNGDGSDDGSGAQSSRTKQPTDGPRDASPLTQLTECPDSTCAQVMRPIAEASSNEKLHTAVKGEAHKEEQADHISDRKDLIAGMYGYLELQPENPIQISTKLIDTRHNGMLAEPIISSSSKKNKGWTNPSGERKSTTHEAINIESAVPQLSGSKSEPHRELTYKLESKNYFTEGTKERGIELSLKRPRVIEDTGKTIRDSHNVLRHSELSAFSRYNTSSNALKTRNEITGNRYVTDNSLEMKKGAVSDNNIDMGSTTNKFRGNQVFFASESTSTINGLHPSSACKLVRSYQRDSPQQPNLLNNVDVQASSVLSPTEGLHRDLQIQHSPHHHHHFHNFEEQKPLVNHDKSSVEKSNADAPHYGSSNIFGGHGDGNLGGRNLNRSASGSNYGSNDQKGSSIAVNAVGTNVESNMGLGRRSGSGEANGGSCGNGFDHSKIAQREAALSKFRQKQNERCFKKKVRYQKRKRLAEQQPRVRGQFVRRTDDNSNTAPNGND